jgi:hypothetical protein
MLSLLLFVYGKWNLPERLSKPVSSAEICILNLEGLMLIPSKRQRNLSARELRNDTV